MKQNVLITGGAGFIGTHLCRRLAAMGINVSVLDLKTPTEPVDNVTYVKGDVRDSAAIQKALAGIDTVFHFAAIVSVPECQGKPLESYQTNLMGTAQVLNAISSLKQKTKVVFAGSAAVYGHLGRISHSLSEDQQLPTPLSFYGAQKLGSEQMIQVYRQTQGLSAVVFRFFNVYGPGQDASSPYSGVISKFSQLIRSQQSLSLHNGGVQTRDFISVHDIVEACVKAHQLPLAECDANPINLGSGNSITVEQLANEMMRAFKTKVECQHTAARDGDVQHSTANIERAKTILNWTPQVDIGAGLNEMASMEDSGSSVKKVA